MSNDVDAARVEPVVMPFWMSMETAPTDGTYFIGLMKCGLVFKTHWQAYHSYLTPEEAESTGLRGFHPTKMTYGWSYEDSDSCNPCHPVGWIPYPGDVEVAA